MEVPVHGYQIINLGNIANIKITGYYIINIKSSVFFFKFLQIFKINFFDGL